MPKIRSFVFGLLVIVTVAWFAPRPMTEDSFGGKKCNAIMAPLTCTGGGACPSISHAVPRKGWAANIWYNSVNTGNCNSWTVAPNGVPCGAFTFFNDYYGWCQRSFL